MQTGKKDHHINDTLWIHVISENSYDSCDADSKLGAGDNEKNLEQNVGDDSDEISQIDNPSGSILNDVREWLKYSFSLKIPIIFKIAEVEESSESSDSGKESSTDDSESNDENGEEIEYKNEETKIEENPIIIEFESTTTSENKDFISNIQSIQSSAKEMTVGDNNRSRERPREYISLLGPDTFIKTGEFEYKYF